MSTTELHGVADTFCEPSEDADFVDLVNAVLTRRYPGVTFTSRGSNDWNWLVNGQGAPIVSDEIDYEGVICSTPSELRAELQP